MHEDLLTGEDSSEPLNICSEYRNFAFCRLLPAFVHSAGNGRSRIHTRDPWALVAGRCAESAVGKSFP